MEEGYLSQDLYVGGRNQFTDRREEDGEGEEGRKSGDCTGARRVEVGE